MNIIIVTRLHENIYRSHGGGENTVWYTWKAGPRNLIKAANKLISHSRRMKSDFGNVGHVSTWLEIGGQRIHDADLFNLLNEECRDGKSATGFAKEVLGKMEQRNEA